MFIDPADRAAVTDDQGNTIWVKAKMDLATRNTVQDAIAAVKGDDSDAVEIHMGSYNTALLVYNIVAWEGPAFLDARDRAVACTPANIKRLDPDDPMVDLVLAEINRRNARPQAPDPNSHTADGFTSDTA